ncbi:MAG: hypothetical protein ACLQJR_22150 [Stellaceae bacterium]
MNLPAFDTQTFEAAATARNRRDVWHSVHLGTGRNTSVADYGQSACDVHMSWHLPGDFCDTPTPSRSIFTDHIETTQIPAVR